MPWRVVVAAWVVDQIAAIPGCVRVMITQFNFQGMEWINDRGPENVNASS
jgi:hypothetical protein